MLGSSNYSPDIPCRPRSTEKFHSNARVHDNATKIFGVWVPRPRSSSGDEIRTNNDEPLRIKESWTIFGAMVVLALTMSATAAPEQKSPLLHLRRGFNPYDFLDNSAARAKSTAPGPVPDPKPVPEAVAGPAAVPGPPQTPGVPA
ncbi:hypothetical protein BGZ82_000127 [Podila clonocystis]|nr:hypothetical protein BGZ82_000127 [Podila clonocystis]